MWRKVGRARSMIAWINDLHPVGRTIAWAAVGAVTIAGLLFLYWLVWVIGFIFHLWGDFGR
jgi:hypothetical protein